MFAGHAVYVLIFVHLFSEKQRIVQCAGRDHGGSFSDGVQVYKVAYQYILCMFNERRNVISVCFLLERSEGMASYDRKSHTLDHQ